MTYHSDKRTKRSFLLLGGQFKFLFSGSANQNYLDNLKYQVKQIYQNQWSETNILHEVITVTNISKHLINENRNKINTIIGTITTLSETIQRIISQLGPLFTASRLMLLQNKFMIHHSRVQILVKQLHNDVSLIRQY